MRIFNAAVIFMFVIFMVSCENNVQKANDSIVVPDEDEAVNDEVTNDENQLNDEIISGDEDVLNDETLQTDSDLVGDEVTGPDEDNIQPNDDDGGSCSVNSNCKNTYFCKKTAGACESDGVCEEMPLGCGEMYAPVCGCDGSTYSNECLANSAGFSVFYSTICLNEMKNGSINFNYSKNAINEDMTGKVTFTYDSMTTELLLLFTPTVEKTDTFSNVTVDFKGINGIYVEVKIAFPRDPFELPQDFMLDNTGSNTATVMTDSGGTVGYLTGTLTVTGFETDITGKFVKFSFIAPALEFTK